MQKFLTYFRLFFVQYFCVEFPGYGQLALMSHDIMQ